MEINEQLEIIKQLNDNRNKLSALFSLYNSSLLVAENNRTNLSNYYEQLIDIKNDASTLSKDIYAVTKDKRAEMFTKSKSKIKRMDADVLNINKEFNDSCNKYRIALQDCGSLKTEYRHNVAELCKQFKASVNDDTPEVVIKGYKQQVKIIKAILDKIELLVADYNVKKNKMEEDNVRFGALYGSVTSLISQLQSIA